LRSPPWWPPSSMAGRGRCSSPPSSPTSRSPCPSATPSSRRHSCSTSPKRGSRTADPCSNSPPELQTALRYGELAVRTARSLAQVPPEAQVQTWAAEQQRKHKNPDPDPTPESENRLPTGSPVTAAKVTRTFRRLEVDLTTLARPWSTTSTPTDYEHSYTHSRFDIALSTELPVVGSVDLVAIQQLLWHWTVASTRSVTTRSISSRCGRRQRWPQARCTSSSLEGDDLHRVDG
jgi:hypothetical protein